MAQPAARKKYIVVTPFFPSEGNFRGAFIHDQVKALRRLTDFDIIIYRPLQPWQTGYDYVYDGFQVRFFKAALTPSHLFSGIFNGLNSRIFKRKLRKDEIRPEEVVAVHCHTAACGAYGLALKTANQSIKHFLQHHDADPYQIRLGKWNGWWPNMWVKAICNKRLFPKIDLHICVSDFVRKHLVDFPVNVSVYKDYEEKIARFAAKGFKGATELNTTVLYNGIDTEIYNSHNRLKHQDGIFRIGCVGNFQDLKSQITLIKAIEYLKTKYPEAKFKCLFVGTGPTLATCKHYIAKAGLENTIDILAEMPHSQLPGFYRSLDLFVLPSYFEGFGCVFTEAYACGTPFLVCKDQGAAEYIPDSQRRIWEFTPLDWEELAAKIWAIKDSNPSQILQHPIDINTLVEAMLSSNDIL